MQCLNRAAISMLHYVPRNRMLEQISELLLEALPTMPRKHTARISRLCVQPLKSRFSDTCLCLTGLSEMAHGPQIP